jgi:endoglucanase
MASWGANVVRIALNQDFWLAASPLHDPNYPALVDSAVTWAEAAGMDVILDLHWSDKGVLGGCNPAAGGCQQMMADANSLTFWSEVAARYKGDGRVLFELYNEPHDVSWDVWRSGGDTGAGWRAVGMQQLHDAVRAAGAENLVVIGGLHWGYDLSGVPTHRIAGHNILYATHPYDNARERGPRYWDLYWGSLTATDPVLVTEFGNTSGDCSTDFLAAVIAYADAHAAGWTAWAWFPGGCTFPALIDDWMATPSAVGVIVRAALQGYDDPPATPRPSTASSTALAFAFDKSAEGWAVDHHPIPDFTNLGASPPPGVAPPLLTFASAGGDPPSGALRFAATFTALSQRAQVVTNFGPPGIDLSGKTITARVRLVSGRLSPGGVQLSAFSGDDYDAGFGPFVDTGTMTIGDWVPLSIDLDATGNPAFRSSQVVQLGVILLTNESSQGGPPEVPGNVVIEIDTVAAQGR